jgi:protocatechuate 3,4-dioxygenase, beta subunit
MIKFNYAPEIHMISLNQGVIMKNRRSFLKLAGLSGISTLLTMKAASSAVCDFRETPVQPLGPFYPKKFPVDTDVDLTKVTNNGKKAKGQVVIVQGIVTDEFCRPVKGAIVEIWQACHTGKYNHPSDTSENELDPDFQYYGTMKTNEQGEYSFKTIKPGSYLASEKWRRPPHIHYKVSLSGYHQLITQLYFAGDELNNTDRILQDIEHADQKKVVVDFLPQMIDGEKVLKGKFDITITRI